MFIARVDLENVKSYERVSVAFRYGTNAICGQNGAGKSTLLEAIGFALFDHLAVTQDDFVRRGEKTATVTVAVEAEDGRTYEIVRRCGSSSAYYAYDAELEQRLTDGKAETMLWLQDFLGMEANADLATLFRDAVGVPQGLLTAAFLETPSRRKDVFNPLLRVDEYEQVWSDLREPRRWLELRITEQEKAIAGLQGQVTALPEARKRAASLSTEIAEAERERQARETALEEVTAQLTTFDNARSELDALNQKVSKAEVDVEALEHRREGVAAAVADAEAARDVVDETREGFEVYEATQQTLSELASDRAERDHLQEELRAVEKDLALARQRLVDLDAQLEAIEAAQEEMARLEPKVERQDTLEASLDQARLRADRLESARQTLKDEERRLTEMRSQMETMDAEIQERESVDRELADLRDHLAEVEAERENLAAEVASKETERARLSSEHEAATARLEELAVALARAEESLASIRERESEIKEGLETRREAEEALSEERSELEKLGIEIETLTADQAAHRTRLEQMEARIAALETGTAEEATCPVCGQTLTQEHREALLGRYHQELAESHEVLESLKDERRELEQKRQVRLEKVETLEFDLQTLPRPKDIEDVAERVAAHQEEVASRQVSVEETRERVSHLDSQLGDVKHAVADLREKLESTTEQRASLQDAVRSQEVRLDALPRPAELDQLRDRMNVQTSVVDEHQETVANLSDAPDEVKNLSTALEALGNPRRDYQRAGDVAERRPEVIQARADVESEQVAHQAKATSLKEKLDAYGDLDARIETERSILNEHEAAHRRYVAHLREAEALDGYQETHRQVTSELSEARETLETVRTAQEKARTAYDPEAHAEARDTRGNLRERLAALNERLAQRRLQLSETEAEIDRLQTLAAELETAASERDTLESLQRLLEYLRGVLREAGPVITRRLVDVISLRADRLYREIMQDYAARLRWTEDYDIILKQGGRERSFQQLSGGEQMAAALAVRLALLQEVSTVDVAFFDEPTANLDERRRANLAEQILGIQGFNQLFVISHDDTFEQDTDHVIRVRKDDGVSQVEV